MADTPPQTDTPPNPETTPAWTSDSSRWSRGGWEYHPGDWENDATKDAPWEDPSILRRHIGTASEVPPWEGDGFAGLLGRARFGLYFSLTTFVTLGYGDYAPTGWFKLVTGFEALFGVTLLALFTVAWGRKMVR
ncbi:MAG: potassium channel family protein [Planctomycetota bacterium]|nr:potassium channel family protein [Planctomycetota bacterium]